MAVELPFFYKESSEAAISAASHYLSVVFVTNCLYLYADWAARRICANCRSMADEVCFDRRNARACCCRGSWVAFADGQTNLCLPFFLIIRGESGSIF